MTEKKKSPVALPPNHAIKEDHVPAIGTQCSRCGMVAMPGNRPLERMILVEYCNCCWHAVDALRERERALVQRLYPKATATPTVKDLVKPVRRVMCRLGRHGRGLTGTIAEKYVPGQREPLPPGHPSRMCMRCGRGWVRAGGRDGHEWVRVRGLAR